MLTDLTKAVNLALIRRQQFEWSMAELWKWRDVIWLDPRILDLLEGQIRYIKAGRKLK